MLTLTGIVRSATTVGGGTSKKTGEVFAKRSVVQIEGFDNRGLVQLYTLTVPDLAPFQGKVGDTVSLPVRAWTIGGTVNLSFEGGATAAP